MNYDTATFEQIWEYESENCKSLSWEHYTTQENQLITGKFIDENINFIYYLKNGKFHRTDGPAIIKKNNKLCYISWYKNSFYHRTDGPALIYYGSISNGNWYFINGIEISKEKLDFLTNLQNKNKLIIL